MENIDNELLGKIKNILIKKAEGYNYKEETEEYVAKVEQENEQLNFLNENNPTCLSPPKKSKQSMTLSKKKVSSHHIPPDLSAVKMLLDYFVSSKTDINLESLSDSELKAMRDDLIKKLSEL